MTALAALGCALAALALAAAAAPAAEAGVLDPLGALPVSGSVYETVRAPHCSLAGAKTIVANRQVRIFGATHPKLGGLVFGCLRSANRAYVLGIAGECQNNDVVDTAVVAGTVAALNVSTCGLASSESRIAVVTLRNGHVVFASTPMSTPGNPDGYDAIRAMVLTPRGRVAWIGVRILRGAIIQAEVRRRAHGPDRQAVLIDSGADIDTHSLRRRGSRVSWVRGGRSQSASM